MKKFQLIVVALITLTVTSCKKDYTCVCTNSSGTKTAFTVKTTKAKAQKQCNDYYNSNYGSITFDQTVCEIK